MINYAFLSYSRKDIDFARYLRALLADEGISIWMDDALVTGMDWSAELASTIDDCSALIVIMSPNSEESKFVQSEILHAMDRNKPLFPVLLQGTEPFFLLKPYQFENMHEGLSATPSDSFLERLKAEMGIDEDEEAQATQQFDFDVSNEDVLEIDCDILLLKFAGHWYGVDRKIRSLFHEEAATRKDSSFALDKEALKAGTAQLRATEGLLAARHVFVMPTDRLESFEYNTIRKFTQASLEELLGQTVSCHHVVMTMHGAGFGLDETECFLAQLGGLLDTLIASPQALGRIQKITIVEKNKARSSRMLDVAKAYFDSRDMDWQRPHLAIIAGSMSYPVPTEVQPQKAYGLVLSNEDMDDDIFCYGIQHPLHAMGLLCERIKPRSPDGLLGPGNEWFDTTCDRIRQASVFVVHLPVASDVPIFFLLLGFAWGDGVPTICFHSEQQATSFDNGDCITYSKIWDLETKLGKWLAEQKPRHRRDSSYTKRVSSKRMSSIRESLHSPSLHSPS